MKILFVIDSLKRAGAEQSIVNLLPALKALGHECAAAPLRAPYDLGETLERAGIPVHRQNLTHPWNIPEGVHKLGKTIRGGGYDAVVSHLFLGAVYVGLSRIVAPRPVRVSLFHNVDYEVIKHSSPVRRVRKAGHLALLRRYMDSYIGVSDAVARHYHDLLGARYPVGTIFNAFPVDALRREANFDRADFRAAYGIEPGSFVFVAVSRLIHQKGHRFLFEALEELGKKNLRPIVLLLGTGPLREELEADVRQRKLEGQVRFLGVVPHDEVLRFVQAADAFIMPSTHEGLPMAAAEAMALECPVLATRIGGIEELIEDGVSGLLAPPRDPAALAAGIERFMADPALRRRLGSDGRARVEAGFDAATIAAQWEELLARLCRERQVKSANKKATSRGAIS